MFIKPASGMKVPDPEMRDYLPAEGRTVTPSEYWTRRLLDGDVLRHPPSAPSAPVPAPSKVKE